MKKIVLALDDLEVDSFPTDAGIGRGVGTVRGFASALPRCSIACSVNDTCQQGSCFDTCLVPLTGMPCVGC